jgi:hypothetical protein
MKFPDQPEYQETIRLSKSAISAKKLGKSTQYAVRPDWSSHRDEVMAAALHEKFGVNHPELRDTLLGTGDAILQKASPGDNYWGTGKTGKGQNKMGTILMEVRNELRAGLPAATAVGNTGAFDEMITTEQVVAPVPPASLAAPIGAPTLVIQTTAAPVIAEQVAGTQPPVLNIMEVSATAPAAPAAPAAPVDPALPTADPAVAAAPVPAVAAAAPQMFEPIITGLGNPIPVSNDESDIKVVTIQPHTPSAKN